ncbi:MAG: hypothetical protein ACRD0O_16685 [Acidimicrobiia bacterium]
MTTTTGRAQPALTARQRQVLDFIEDHVARHHYPPSSRELSAACGLGGASGAQRMVETLERKGYLHRVPGRKRALTLAAPPVDPAALDAEDLYLISAMAEGQSVERDCMLAVAAWVSDPAVKHTLITEALERHVLVADVEALLDASGTGRPDARGAMSAVLTTMRSRSSWADFVVDQIVYNRSAAPVARFLAGRVPALAAIFGRDAVLCDRAADTAEGWLEDHLRTGADPGSLEALRIRAETMLKVCALAARALRRGGAGAKVPDLMPVELPSVLRR